MRWSFATAGPPRLAPTIWRGKVYFGTDAGVAWCLRARDGAVVWKLRAAPTNEKMLAIGRLVSLWPMRTGYLTVTLIPRDRQGTPSRAPILAGIEVFRVRAR